MDNPADDEEPAVGLLDLPLTFLTQLVQHPYCEGLRSVCQRLFALGLAASSQACFMLDDGQTIESAATAVALAERSENVPHLECRRLNGTLADILVAAAAQLGVQSLPSFTELTLIVSAVARASPTHHTPRPRHAVACPLGVALSTAVSAMVMRPVCLLCRICAWMETCLPTSLHPYSQTYTPLTSATVPWSSRIPLQPHSRPPHGPVYAHWSSPTCKYRHFSTARQGRQARRRVKARSSRRRYYPVSPA